MERRGRRDARGLLIHWRIGVLSGYIQSGGKVRYFFGSDSHTRFTN